MKWLVLESWLRLLYFDFLMHRRSFEALHDTVRKTQVCPVNAQNLISSTDLCCAVDLACVFYFKRVMCLQRSAATAQLLRNHGWKSEMVIGAQLVPPKFHAWCEVNGAIVNDKPYMLDIYQVLERC